MYACVETKILADIPVEMETASMTAFEDYIGALERAYVTKIQRLAHGNSVGYGDKESQKRSFVDPSIAVAAIGASPYSLESDLQAFGFILGCMCIRDLKVY